MPHLAVKLLYTFAVVLFGASSAFAETPGGGKFRVGVSTALTGNAAFYGTGVQNGVKLAQEMLDPTGAVEFLIQDDRFQPHEAASNIQRFINQDQVQALIVFGSGPSMAAAPTAEQRKIPLIGLATAEALTKDRQYVFQHFGQAERENQVLAAEVRRRGYKDIALVTAQHDGMISLRDAFLRDFPDAVSANEEVLPGDTALRATALRIAARRPQAVYEILLPGQAGTFARELRDLHYQGEIFGCHVFEDPHEVELAHGALQGSWFVSINPVADPNFVSRYKQRFGSEPAFTAGYGFDSAKLLIDAAKAGHSAIDHLRAAKEFDGVFGHYGLGQNNSFDVPVTLKVVRDGSFERLH